MRASVFAYATAVTVLILSLAPEGWAAPSAGPPPSAWVVDRARDAQARLEDDPAGRLVWRSIEAHGGLARWLSKGTVEFTFDYKPVGKPKRRIYTRNRVDLWSARAEHTELGEGADAHFGWNGGEAWIEPGPEAIPTTARFWALTPYYFVGMPFVVADPGVRFARLADAELDGRTYQLVKITYEPGTGDAPDDYYILYLDPDSGRLAALRYVVSFPGFFPEGGHTPEKLMRYSEFETHDELVFAHRLDTYAFSEGKGPQAKVTEIRVSDYRLGRTIPGSTFDPPPGAQTSSKIEVRRR